MATSSISEIRDFHPLVAQWLTDNGYSYQHHWELPLGGVADFRALRDEITYFVECKCHEDAKKLKSIRQLLSYTVQSPNSKGIFAVPLDLFDNEIKQICEEFNIIYLPIEGEFAVRTAYAPTKLDGFAMIFKSAAMGYSLMTSVFDPIDVWLEIVYSIVKKAIECYTNAPSTATIHAMAQIAAKSEYNADILHMDRDRWVFFLTNVIEDELSSPSD